ncbi:hydroxymethylbilane synthase [Nocardia inohanensis]|uniref:hydroxymethylbilane synthase n=1 Tax=Nocardia inohanensis TaxID=209246 RepID=UPI000A0554B6|nr:hydroxymethylbilane synthase [Nocardia inohanensis]
MTTDALVHETEDAVRETTQTGTTKGTAENPWRIGTRGSLLALTQAGTVRDELIANGQIAELIIVKTAGDQNAVDPVQTIGVGVFTAALRDELAAGSVDIAVHSYKDLPTAQDPRFTIAAIPPREDPRDALVARDGLVLGELPAGSVIGTSAPRRSAQLKALGLGVEIVPLRGNLDTRLSKVAKGELDAVVVARAGLSRIDRLDAVTEALEPVQMLPAPAQGALAVECRSADTELVTILSALDDAGTRAAITAERALLAELEAGCTAPIGALAEVVESLDDDGRVVDELSLRGCAAAIDGSDVIRASAVGSLENAEQLGRALARELLELGARELLSAPEAAGSSGGSPEVERSSAAVNDNSSSNPSPMENNR